YRRIEVMFPVENPTLRSRVLREVLGVPLRDNVKARLLQVDARYVPNVPDAGALAESQKTASPSSPAPKLRSQEVLLAAARRAAEAPAQEPVLRPNAPPLGPGPAERLV